MKRLIAALIGIVALGGGSVGAAPPDTGPTVEEVLLRGCLEGAYPVPIVLTSTRDNRDDLDLALAYCTVAADVLQDSPHPQRPVLLVCALALTIEYGFLDISLLGGSINAEIAERFEERTSAIAADVSSILAGGEGDCTPDF